MLALVILVCSALYAIAAYITFYKQVIDRDTQPNGWGWFIWAWANLTEALTYDAVSGDPMKSYIFFLSTGLCFVTAIAVCTRAEWSAPTWTERLTVVAGVAAMIVLFYFHEAWWAHVVMLAFVPISFFPEWTKAWVQPQSHRPLAWSLWAAGDFFALIVVVLLLDDIKELPYAVLEFGSHYLMLFIIVIRRRGV